MGIVWVFIINLYNIRQGKGKLIFLWFLFLIRSWEMTKHTHKYPTAFQIVQRWFSGVLHLWASLHRAVPHKTTAHLAMAHTDTQTCNATDAKSSHNLLWLLLQRNLLHSLPPPAKLFLSQLSFSKDEVQPYRKGTITTMLFKESKKQGWGW